jgi:hypothetical protein
MDYWRGNTFRSVAQRGGKGGEEEEEVNPKKFALEQAMKTQRGSRGIALLFL